MVTTVGMRVKKLNENPERGSPQIGKPGMRQVQVGFLVYSKPPIPWYSVNHSQNRFGKIHTSYSNYPSALVSKYN
jgi:hypothetical protein